MQKFLLTLLFALSLAGCSTQWFGGGSAKTITVSRGDTLYSISRRFGVPLRDIIDTNRLTPPYTLRVGQRLYIPANNYHIVSTGDTLYNISRRYGVAVQTIASNNGLEAPYTLAIGQRLAITKVSTAYSAVSQPTTSSTRAYTAATPTKAKVVSKNRKAKFAWPVQGSVISNFGAIGKGRANDGINIKASRGSAVKAADSGAVAYAGNELKGFGNLILIRHSDGWITAYAHNEKLLVKKGQSVQKGEKIATVGTTGGVNTAQLHFEVRAGKTALNPRLYLP